MFPLSQSTKWFTTSQTIVKLTRQPADSARFPFTGITIVERVFPLMLEIHSSWTANR